VWIGHLLSSLSRYVQLEFDFVDEVEVRVPWSGRSPRELTRAFRTFSLASEGTGRPNLSEPAVQGKLRL